MLRDARERELKMRPTEYKFVMPGLVPGIHVLWQR